MEDAAILFDKGLCGVVENIVVEVLFLGTLINGG
jgi:hypothetical protein